MAIEVNILTQPKIQASIKTFVSTSEDYQNGYSDGYYKGKNDGEKQGAQSEYDRFWDAFQQNGNRTDYQRAFGGLGWTLETFKPKYNIKPTGVDYQMFGGTGITDLVQALANAGVTIDFSNCTAFQYTFYSSQLTRVGIVDMSKATMTSNMFTGCSKLVTVDELRNIQRSCTFSNNFSSATDLENLTVSGTIGQNGFNVSSCTKLTHDSLMSIINALKDYSGTGTTRSVTLGTTNLAKLTDTEKAIATQKGWTLA